MCTSSRTATMAQIRGTAGYNLGGGHNTFGGPSRGDTMNDPSPLDAIREQTGKIEDFLDTLSDPIKPYLPAIGRFLIVVTFLEDALRIITQWSDQLLYLHDYRHIPYGLTHLFLMINVIAMVSCSSLVIARKYSDYAVGGLIGVVITQALGYGLIFDLNLEHLESHCCPFGIRGLRYGCCWIQGQVQRHYACCYPQCVQPLGQQLLDSSRAPSPQGFRQVRFLSDPVHCRRTSPACQQRTWQIQYRREEEGVLNGEGILSWVKILVGMWAREGFRKYVKWVLPCIGR